MFLKNIWGGEKNHPSSHHLTQLRICILWYLCVFGYSVWTLVVILLFLLRLEREGLQLQHIRTCGDPKRSFHWPSWIQDYFSETNPRWEMTQFLKNERGCLRVLSCLLICGMVQGRNLFVGRIEATGSRLMLLLPGPSFHLPSSVSP